MAQARPDITLHALAGPHGGTYSSDGRTQLTIGRAVESDVCLLHETVSRRHAAIVARPEGWFLMDQGSALGTWLNGQRVSPAAPLPLISGDLVRVGPWSFRVSIGRMRTSAAATIADDRGPAPLIERVGQRPLPAGARQLRMLMQGLSRMSSAPNEHLLARAALDAAMAGANCSHGAVLRPGSTDEEVAIIAASGGAGGETAEFAFSRSLIRAASSGQTAILSGADAAQNASRSVSELSIRWAVCAPVFVGAELASLLYVDARQSGTGEHTEAANFCEAVANAYGLALANLKRVELERRQSALAAELAAAREAQQFIMPPAHAAQGFLGYAMQMRPGVFVAGDMFDVVPLEDGRVAVCIGDVSGHGAASAMLMAAAQSQLNAQVRATRDAGAAVSGLNRYLGERSLGGRFVSLWLGIFSRDGVVEFVDAGHGYWLVRTAAGLRGPGAGTAIPAGIDAGTRYEASRLVLAPGDRIVLYSDGVIDERNPAGEPFGQGRLEHALAAARNCDADVIEIFKAVARFAEGAPPTDDATAASIEFLGTGEG